MNSTHVGAKLLIPMATSHLSKCEGEKSTVTETFVGFGMKSPIDYE